MEENKQHLREDTFIKKYVQEIKLDTPSSKFTSSIMDVLLEEEAQKLTDTKPLIPKGVWLGIAAFVMFCLYSVFKKGTSLGIEFPTIKTDFLTKIQVPSFDSLSVSTTMMYAVVVFAMMVFVQVFYLKNHFNKQFD